LIDRRWLTSILDVRPYWGADCDAGYCVLIAEVRERLSVRKQDTKKTVVKRLNLNRLSELDLKKKYQTEISNRFAISMPERKQQKPWFDGE
jgi:hypothetical protein